MFIHLLCSLIHCFLIFKINRCRIIFKGKRPSRPSNCPNNIWNLIKTCWIYDYFEPPSFKYIMKFMKNDQNLIDDFGKEIDLIQLHKYQDRMEIDLDND